MKFDIIPDIPPPSLEAVKIYLGLSFNMLQIICKNICTLQFFFAVIFNYFFIVKSIISLSFEAKLQKNTSSFSIFNHFTNIVQKIMGPLQILYSTHPEFISYGIMYHPTKFGSCIIFCTKLTYFLSYSPYYKSLP